MTCGPIGAVDGEPSRQRVHRVLDRNQFRLRSQGSVQWQASGGAVSAGRAIGVDSESIFAPARHVRHAFFLAEMRSRWRTFEMIRA
jgi:hypothetical protein